MFDRKKICSYQKNRGIFFIFYVTNKHQHLQAMKSRSKGTFPLFFQVRILLKKVDKSVKKKFEMVIREFKTV